MKLGEAIDKTLSVEAALLQVLGSGPGYGLELIDRLQERSGGRFLAEAVYPALRSLEWKGLIRSYNGEPLPERGGRSRRYYELTGRCRAGLTLYVTNQRR